MAVTATTSSPPDSGRANVTHIMTIGNGTKALIAGVTGTYYVILRAWFSHDDTAAAASLIVTDGTTSPAFYFPDATETVELTGLRGWHTKAGGSLSITVGGSINNCLILDVATITNGQYLPLV